MYNITNLKALIVAFPIALAVFVMAKSICLRFMTTADFARRRNIFLALTVVAFVSPSFWLFVLVAIPVLAWGAQKDAHPVALYLLTMHVIPADLYVQIPVVGINKLFGLDMYRILAFSILIPVAWRHSTSQESANRSSPAGMDALILAFVALQIILLLRVQPSMTNVVREAFLIFLDILLLYYVFSRTCTTRTAIVDAMASFCLAAAVFAPLAVFEAFKGWMLYWEVGPQWGSPKWYPYLFRAGVLRAEVSSGHPLNLGFLMAIALGCWLFLGEQIGSRRRAAVVGIWLCAGLIASYSRGPWLVAVAIYFVYSALSPNALARMSRAALAFAAVAGGVLVSPYGQRVIDSLPFVGTVDASTVEYRQRLAARSWELIQQKPWFGDPFFLNYLEDLRQGQGIIDLVNAYAAIAMKFGLVTLGLLMGFLLLVMWKAYHLSMQVKQVDPQLSQIGAVLVACMIGTLLMMAAGGLNMVGYCVAGLAAGYSQLANPAGAIRERPTSARQLGPR